MKRAELIRLGLVGISASILAPRRAIAEKRDPKAGGVYLTAEAPGRWGAKISGHLPQITSQTFADGSAKIRVETAHPADEFAHYIIKHQLLDADFNYLAEQFFDPTTGTLPISEFTLPTYRGTIYALSVCNVHDVWLNSATI